MKLTNVVMLTSLPLVPGHIIFDEVGTVAGAVSYVHLAINVDFASIRAASAQAELALDNYEAKVQPLIPKEFGNQKNGELTKQYQLTHTELMTNRRTKLRRLQRRLDDIQHALPRRDRARRGFDDVKVYLDSAKAAVHTTKAISKSFTNALGISATLSNILANGAFGNFLSIFNPLQLGTIRLAFSKMIECFTSHDEFLTDNQRLFQNNDNSFTFGAYLQALQSESNFNTAFDAIERSLDDVAFAMQEAQHNRLAIELVPLTELQRLFNELQQEADRTGTQMIITAPAHLFQLETSFIYDGDNAALLVHVPLIPPGTLSTLYKLRPFPIPIGDGNVIMPRESPSLLAKSNQLEDKWSIVQQYNLHTCSKVNNIYVCPGQGILHSQTESTCLGALYLEKVPLAKELCTLDIIPEYELAVPLDKDRFLVYALTTHTASLECPGKRLEAVHIPQGISQQTIPEACLLKMSRTTVFSQFSLRLSGNVKYYKWDLPTIQEFDITTYDIEQARKDLDRTRQGAVTVSDVIKHKKRWYEKDTVRSLAIAATAGAGLITLLLAVSAFVAYRIYRAFTNRQTVAQEDVENLRQYVNDKFTHVSRASVRLKSPTPPFGTPTSLPRPRSRSQDQLRLHRLDDDLQNRLRNLQHH